MGEKIQVKIALSPQEIWAYLACGRFSETYDELLSFRDLIFFCKPQDYLSRRKFDEMRRALNGYDLFVIEVGKSENITFDGEKVIGYVDDAVSMSLQKKKHEFVGWHGEGGEFLIAGYDASKIEIVDYKERPDFAEDAVIALANFVVAGSLSGELSIRQMVWDLCVDGNPIGPRNRRAVYGCASNIVRRLVGTVLTRLDQTRSLLPGTPSAPDIGIWKPGAEIPELKREQLGGGVRGKYMGGQEND